MHYVPPWSQSCPVPPQRKHLHASVDTWWYAQPVVRHHKQCGIPSLEPILSCRGVHARSAARTPPAPTHAGVRVIHPHMSKPLACTHARSSAIGRFPSCTLAACFDDCTADFSIWELPQRSTGSRRSASAAVAPDARCSLGDAESPQRCARIRACPVLEPLGRPGHLPTRSLAGEPHSP